MAGAKGRSGGRRPGAGAKSKAELVQLHNLIESRVVDDDWTSIIAALVEKAKKGDVQAFRELRACRFGQIPLAEKYLPGELFAINQTVEELAIPHMRRLLDESAESLDQIADESESDSQDTTAI